MIEIPLTTFIDFALANGTKRVSVVEDAKFQHDHEYDPSSDYYRGIRNGTIDLHQKDLPVSHLYDVVAASHYSRQLHFREIADGYVKWLGRKSPIWQGQISEHWVSGTLGVRVNPELLLEIAGEKLAIKLYFKTDTITKPRIDYILHLMDSTIVRRHPGVISAVLDVRRAKLHKSTIVKPKLGPLLTAEAAAFVSIWQSIAPSAPVPPITSGSGPSISPGVSVP